MGQARTHGAVWARAPGFSRCGPGPMMSADLGPGWDTGVQGSDLQEIFASHIQGGTSDQRDVDTFGVTEPNKTPGSH